MARPAKSDLLRFFGELGSAERIRPKKAKANAEPKTPEQLFEAAVDTQIANVKLVKDGKSIKKSWWFRAETDGRYSLQFGQRALPIDGKKFFPADTLDDVIALLEKGKGLTAEPSFMKTYEADRAAQAEKVAGYNANRKNKS